MKDNLPLAISIIGSVLAILSFYYARKREASKATGESEYYRGKLDTTLKNIIDKLDKIENKIDNYDKEIDEKIDKKIQEHEKVYHSNINR